MINQESARVSSEYGYEVATPAPVNPWLIYLGWVLIGSVVAVITTLLMLPLIVAENNSLFQLGAGVLGVVDTILVAILGGLLIQRGFAVKWYLWAAVTAGTGILFLMLSTLGSIALNSVLRNGSIGSVGLWYSIYGIGYTLLSGLIIGGAQAWLLNKTTSYAYLWAIGVTFISLLLNLGFAFFVTPIYDVIAGLTDELSSSASVLLASRIGLTISTVLETLLTGLVLVFLLYANRNRQRYGQRGTL